jgi:predicted DNA-binding protein
MERINLNVPSELRRNLRRLAKRVGKSESLVVRELLGEALEARERAAFYRRVAETQTAEVSERDLLVLDELENIRGESR